MTNEEAAFIIDTLCRVCMMGSAPVIRPVCAHCAGTAKAAVPECEL